MGDDFNKVLILADYGSINLAKKVHKELSKLKMYGGLEEFNVEDIYINKFNNGEIDVKLKSSMRGKDVFLIKSFNVFQKRWDKTKNLPPLDELIYDPNQGYNELFIINDALKRARAKRITNILPHMPYQRQDRRPKRKGEFVRGSISAKLFANLLQTSGATQIITLDPHFKQFEGFYDMGVDCLDSFVLFAEDIENNFKDKIERSIFIAPDHGSVELARDYAKHFKRPYAIIDKRRNEEGKSEVLNIISDIKNLEGFCGFLVDDIIDTGNTIIKASQALRTKGLEEFIVYCTHPVLSLDAKERLLEEDIDLITTNSIAIPYLFRYPNIKIIDTSHLICKAIYCICNGESIDKHLVNFEMYKKDKLTP
ncbi:MAG: ribose-phosphate diphosphokinase [Nanoarchaeota archaeon]|nr:ribose-phosphate diphosphokinase [Nanoarchaeota archaeon]MBU4352168.1 ribose-phosphate diphosphokinase [Nanoarchaeota archaeon]